MRIQDYVDQIETKQTKAGKDYWRAHLLNANEWVTVWSATDREWLANHKEQEQDLLVDEDRFGKKLTAIAKETVTEEMPFDGNEPEREMVKSKQELPTVDSVDWDEIALGKILTNLIGHFVGQRGDPPTESQFKAFVGLAKKIKNVDWNE